MHPVLWSSAAFPAEVRLHPKPDPSLLPQWPPDDSHNSLPQLLGAWCLIFDISVSFSCPILKPILVPSRPFAYTFYLNLILCLPPNTNSTLSEPPHFTLTSPSLPMPSNQCPAFLHTFPSYPSHFSFPGLTVPDFSPSTNPLPDLPQCSMAAVAVCKPGCELCKAALGTAFSIRIFSTHPGQGWEVSKSS